MGPAKDGANKVFCWPNVSLCSDHTEIVCAKQTGPWSSQAAVPQNSMCT